MNHVLVMSIANCLTNLQENAKSPLDIPPLFTRTGEWKYFAKSTPLYKLHCEVGLAIGISSQFVHRHNVGVLKSTGDPSFLKKPRQVMRRGNRSRSIASVQCPHPQHLHREFTIQVFVSDRENRTHSPTTNFISNRVAGLVGPLLGRSEPTSQQATVLGLRLTVTRLYFGIHQCSACKYPVTMAPAKRFLMLGMSETEAIDIQLLTPLRPSNEFMIEIFDVTLRRLFCTGFFVRHLRRQLELSELAPLTKPLQLVETSIEALSNGGLSQSQLICKIAKRNSFQPSPYHDLKIFIQRINHLIEPNELIFKSNVSDRAIDRLSSVLRGQLHVC